MARVAHRNQRRARPRRRHPGRPVIDRRAETMVIAAGGFGGEAQVLWYGPLAYAIVPRRPRLCVVGGAVLGVLPMDEWEIRGWTPSLAMIATLVPSGLFITIFRLRRDVYAEQMPPAPVLLGCSRPRRPGGPGALLRGRGSSTRRSATSPSRPVRSALLAAWWSLGRRRARRRSSARRARSARRGPCPTTLKDRPNLILVMVDTLRADHLSCYGLEGGRTPNICSLGRRRRARASRPSPTHRGRSRPPRRC